MRSATKEDLKKRIKENIKSLENKIQNDVHYMNINERHVVEYSRNIRENKELKNLLEKELQELEELLEKKEVVWPKY